MRFLKLIIVSTIVLFAIVTCIGLLLPSNVIVSRATDISSTNDSIFILSKDLKNWKLWINGFDKVEVKESNYCKVKNSTITITESKKTETDSTIHSIVSGKWIEKNNDEQNFTINLYSNKNTPNKTIAQWQFEQKVQWYPWARFTSMINDKVIGAMLEANLANLKTISEKRQ